MVNAADVESDWAGQVESGNARFCWPVKCASMPMLILLCQQFDEVVDTIGFFKNGCFLKNHIISTRYLLCDSVVLIETTKAEGVAPGLVVLGVVMIVGAVFGRLCVSVERQSVEASAEVARRYRPVFVI